MANYYHPTDFAPTPQQQQGGRSSHSRRSNTLPTQLVDNPLQYQQQNQAGYGGVASPTEDAFSAPAIYGQGENDEYYHDNNTIATRRSSTRGKSQSGALQRYNNDSVPPHRQAAGPGDFNLQYPPPLDTLETMSEHVLRLFTDDEVLPDGPVRLEFVREAYEVHRQHLAALECELERLKSTFRRQEIRGTEEETGGEGGAGDILIALARLGAKIYKLIFKKSAKKENWTFETLRVIHPMGTAFCDSCWREIKRLEYKLGNRIQAQGLAQERIKYGERNSRSRDHGRHSNSHGSHSRRKRSQRSKSVGPSIQARIDDPDDRSSRTGQQLAYQDQTGHQGQPFAQQTPSNTGFNYQNDQPQTGHTGAPSSASNYNASKYGGASRSGGFASAAGPTRADFVGHNEIPAHGSRHGSRARSASGSVQGPAPYSQIPEDGAGPQSARSTASHRTRRESNAAPSETGSTLTASTESRVSHGSKRRSHAAPSETSSTSTIRPATFNEPMPSPRPDAPISPQRSASNQGSNEKSHNGGNEYTPYQQARHPFAPPQSQPNWGPANPPLSAAAQARANQYASPAAQSTTQPGASAFVPQSRTSSRASSSQASSPQATYSSQASSSQASSRNPKQNANPASRQASKASRVGSASQASTYSREPSVSSAGRSRRSGVSGYEREKKKAKKPRACHHAEPADRDGCDSEAFECQVGEDGELILGHVCHECEAR